MNKVMCGGISPEAEVLMTKYLNHFIPDYTIEPISSMGIRGKMKRDAVKPDCIMVILDNDLYESCESTCSDVLKLPKIHRYTDDASFADFLAGMFGKLEEGVGNSEGAGTHGLLHEVEDEDENFNLTEEEAEEEDNRDEVIQQLREKLAQSELAVKNLQEKSKDNDDEISSLCAEIRKLKSQPQVDSSEVEGLNSKINELTKQLGDLQVQYENLASANSVLEKEKSDLLVIKNEKEFLQSELDALRESSSNSDADASALQADIINLKADLEKALADNKRSTETLKELEAQISELTGKNEELQAEASKVDELQKSLDEANAKVTELSEATAGVDALKEEALRVKELEEKLVELDDIKVKASNLEEQVKELESFKATSVDALDKKNLECEELKKISEEKDARIDELTKSSGDIQQVQLELDRVKAELNEKTEEAESLKVAVNDANNSIADLTVKANDLNKFKSEAENLRKELEPLRGMDTELSNAKEKISSLEKQLSDAMLSASSTEDLRAMYSDLEMELAEKDVVINGVFGQMFNMAIPKAAYGFNLPKLSMPNGKFVCTCAGSNESTSTVYYLLKKSLMTSGLRAIIVDLVTDTSIDSQFGASNIKSPIPWLSGEQPFTSFLADTKLPNVKVLTTALSYLNELFLLKVDWNSKIAELQNYADIVIFNIGNINGVVQKILYTQFSQIMQTSIIVKATPLNLRTLILGLTGLNVPKSVRVVCTDYDTNASKGMYKKLSSKYTAQILKDTDILKL